MNILGLSAFYHDSAACLVIDGKIAAAVQEERLTRKKHDASFPMNAAQYCLGQLHSGEKIDLVAFYEKPFIKFERLLETYLDKAPFGLRSFIKAMPLWIKQKLWIKDIIRERLDYKGPIIFPEHHESHAASAFFPSPFDEAAFLTADGVGEWTTTSFGTGRGNRIEIMKEIHFPHSLGLLYSAFTYYGGFKVNSGEYKLMGLAPYGKPKYKDLILSHLIDVKGDGSFRLNLEYFNFEAGLTMTNEKFNRLFGGPPRKPESKITQRDMDIARSIQEVTEEAMLRMARHIHQVTGKKNLCLAGGVALNCVANGRILREGPFDALWVQPAAGDAGGALGAALFAWHQYSNRPRQAAEGRDALDGTLLGPAFAPDEIQAYLKSEKIPFVPLSEQEIPERIADLIAAENIIGWFRGRMEFGPRALGSRSILGDARAPKMQELMNLKIKFRESFRPFAPSVLLEKTREYFDIDIESPYMQFVADVKESVRTPLTEGEQDLTGMDRLRLVRSRIPAVTHVDYSARLQTVSDNGNPVYYRMIKKFDEKYGCPVIINTSLNVRGEPIVCSPQEAYRCFMRTNMDYLLLENCLIKKEEQKPLDRDIDWLREFELD